MGLALAKLYNEAVYKETPIRPQQDSIINVIYEGNDYTLENSLELSSKLPLSLMYMKNNSPSIVLRYPAEDRVLFSLKSNRLHFIILIGDNSRGKEAHTSYPWLSNLDGIRVSRLSEEEYKEVKFYNLMEFRD
jgi:hypothetical protein